MQDCKSYVYADVLKKYDLEIKDIEKDKGRQCCCHEGCTHCCKQIIILSDFEKEILKNEVNSFSDNEKEYLALRSQQIVQKLKHAGITKESINPYLSFEEQQEIQIRYFSENLECPMLKNGRCMIYAHRPVSCMTYKNYGNCSDCEESPFVESSITYNNIESFIRDDIFFRCGETFNGFHVLPFTLLDIVNTKKKKRFYMFIK